LSQTLRECAKKETATRKWLFLFDILGGGGVKRIIVYNSLIGAQYHLWLKNTVTLYGVENLAIAPGYQTE